MLYLETPTGFVPWKGEVIKDVRHPRSIERLWTSEALAGIGLYDPAPADPVPEGKISTGQTVERVNGAVKFVHALTDAPAAVLEEITLTRRQVRSALALSGFPLNAIPDALQSIADPTERALAQIDWEDAPYYKRDHPLFSDEQILAALELDAAAIDAMWMQAKDLPA